jgi:transcriptional regulator with XRE-family HTH domain
MQLARTKEWRESRGFTQRELAAEAGISEVTVARLETGHSSTPPTARKIAKALRVSVADLQERPPVPLASAPQEPGQTKHRGPDETVRGPDEDRPKPLPKSDVTHHVEVHEKITVSDHAKAQLKEHFDALIHDLENIRRSKEAAELARMRDEVLAAVV